MSSNPNKQGYIAWLESQFSGFSPQEQTPHVNQPGNQPTNSQPPFIPFSGTPYAYQAINAHAQQQVDLLIAQQQANAAFYQAQIEVLQRQQLLASVVHDPASHQKLSNYYKKQDDACRKGFLRGFG